MNNDSICTKLFLCEDFTRLVVEKLLFANRTKATATHNNNNNNNKNDDDDECKILIFFKEDSEERKQIIVNRWKVSLERRFTIHSGKGQKS